MFDHMILPYIFQMDLWFAVTPDTDKNFDRLSMLKTALFDIFADHNKIPAVLDYVEMVRNNRVYLGRSRFKYAAS